MIIYTRAELFIKSTENGIQNYVPHGSRQLLNTRMLFILST